MKSKHHFIITSLHNKKSKLQQAFYAANSTCATNDKYQSLFSNYQAFCFSIFILQHLAPLLTTSIVHAPSKLLTKLIYSTNFWTLKTNSFIASTNNIMLIRRTRAEKYKSYSSYRSQR